MAGREPGAPAHLQPRSVPWHQGLVWYEDAMRLFKFAWPPWVGLAILALATELALKALPGGLSLLSEIVSPLVTSGMVYAAAAADRRQRPTLRLALAAFASGGNAIAAVIASSAVSSAAQVFAGWWIADVNLFVTDATTLELAASTLLGIYAIAIVASLPVMFVPFHALLEGASFRAAFAASVAGFARNALPLATFAAATFVLLGFGVLTLGIGFVVVFPLTTAASYAAWKDIFGVDAVDAPRP